MKTNIKAFASQLILTGIIFLIVTGCKKDSPDNIVYKIGDTYQGGKICYLDVTGKHGLIASASDLTNMISWWNGGFVETNSKSDADGSTNTNAIIAAQGNAGSYAAKLCRDYRGGGFNDWFLPAKDQLNMMYLQKTTLGGFADEIYWSSTEYEPGLAWVQYFMTGEQWTDNTSDGAIVCVRAMRAF